MKNIAFKKKKILINLAMKKVDRMQLLLNEDQCCQLSLHLKYVLITLTRSGIGMAQGNDECSLGN